MSDDARRLRLASARRPLVTFAVVLFCTVLLVVSPPIGSTRMAPSPPVEVSSGAWPEDAVVYHVFLDRFADGDPDLNVEQPSDPADALTGWMGGDLAGLRARLGHIAAVGANTIWLSPVSPGPYHHGYHPTELNGVNERFGDVELLATVVEEAQQLGMRVVYDLVLDRTSDRHPWFVEAQELCDASRYERWYAFRSCPDDHAGSDELPQLDLDEPAVRGHVFDEVLPFWLDEIGVDGFRVGYVRGPSLAFWEDFRAVLDERWPGTLLLGAVDASQPVIDSYGGLLDAATAFPLRDQLVAVFAEGGDVRAITGPLGALLQGGDAVPRPATYLSSHDQPRFTFLAGGDTRRTALAYTAILTMPGIPVIYYGDEVGLSQSQDHTLSDDLRDRWFREPMPWDEEEWDHRLLGRIGALARLRTTTPALHSGEHVDLLAEGGTWAFERATTDDRVLVVINTSETTVRVDLAALYGEAVPTGVSVHQLVGAATEGGSTSASDGSLRIEVAGLDAAVLRIDGPLTPADVPRPPP